MRHPLEFELQDVFVLSGVPQHTFVQPVEYTRLLVALRTLGRSSVLVISPAGLITLAELGRQHYFRNSASTSWFSRRS